MRLLDQFVSEPRACAYLPAEVASLEYRLMLDVGAQELEGMLERGWRRFGVAYFRPACARCSQCVPLRIPIDRFKTSRNQRRAWNRGEALRLEVGVPRVDEARLLLYRAWQQSQGTARGWDFEPMDARRYFHEFAFPHPAVREFAYYDGDKLIAISIVDETPQALSAVYTYHDPEYGRHSLGTLSVLRQIEFARAHAKRWVYLGYRVLGCMSSEYKAKFRPHELLNGWPTADEAPDWRVVEDSGCHSSQPRGTLLEQLDRSE